MKANNNPKQEILNLQVLNADGIKSAELLREVVKLDKLESEIISAGKTFEAQAASATRKQAEILDRVFRDKLYAKDDFCKSITEFAERIGMRGGKSAASLLCKSGNVYNDQTAPDSLKSLPPYVLAELPTKDKELRELIFKDASNDPDKFASMTQVKAREYRKTLEDSKPQKAKVTVTYNALMDGEQVNGMDGKLLADTSDGWKSYLESNGQEVCKLSNGKYKPDDEKSLMPRYIVIDGTKAHLVCLFPTEPDRTNGKPKTKTATQAQYDELKTLTKLLLTGAELSDRQRKTAVELGLISE